MIDSLFRYVWRKLGEAKRAEAALDAARARGEVPEVIRQICTIADVPWLAEGFIVHGISPAIVTQTLCGAIRRDPDSGRVAALQALAFLAPLESAQVLDGVDRRWLEQMEQAFRPRDAQTG